MATPRMRKDGNPDLRRQTQLPAPAIEEIEAQIYALLEPSNFKPLRDSPGLDNKNLRERKLTLPVMMAVVVSLVYRQIAGLSEAIRLLATEGLMWVEPMLVSKQALSQRLKKIPAKLFAQVFEQVIEKIHATPQANRIPQQWQQLHQTFGAVWIADGSTLEELRKKLKALSDQTTVLAGKMMMVVEAFTHVPTKIWYTEDSKANDKIFAQELLEQLPTGGLLIFDLGFFKFGWFDQFTQQQKFFVTRLREKTSYFVVRCLSTGVYYRDEIIDMGQYRSNPCQYPVRLVSVLWGNSWYYYLTNVLDPQLLSAQQVCELYRCRWRIEDAFKLTKRLLGLAYIWVGDRNGVQIQIFATVIFYTVLNNLSSQIAFALGQPLERISVEMVFRSLYYFAVAVLRRETDNVVDYLVSHYKLFGLLKAERKRHRQIHSQSAQVWADAP